MLRTFDMRCRMTACTAAWKFLENFSMHFAKNLHFLFNIHNFASFCYQFLQKFIFQKKIKLKIYFGIFTKFSMQLRKFSMHFIHYYMQSEIELWIYFIHFPDFFIMTSRNFHLKQFSVII